MSLTCSASFIRPQHLWGGAKSLYVINLHPHETERN